MYTDNITVPTLTVAATAATDDISCPLGHSSKPNACCCSGRTGQTDTVSFHRLCSTYIVGSAKNQQNRAAKKWLRAQKQTHTETETKTENL